MIQTPSLLSRIVTAVVLALAAISLAACEGSHSSPTAVQLPEDPQNYGGAAYYGDSIIESVVGVSPCGESPTVGTVSTGLRWDEVHVRNGRFVIAYDKMDTYRYEGTMNGLQFADDFQQLPIYLESGCEFREASVSGFFSADFRSFELRETLVYGPPEREHRVVRYHRAARQ